MPNDKPRLETNWVCDADCGKDAVCMVSDATHWVKWCEAGHVTTCAGGTQQRVFDFEAAEKFYKSNA